MCRPCPCLALVLQDLEFQIDEATYTEVMHAVGTHGDFEEAMEIRNGDWYRNYRYSQPWFGDDQEPYEDEYDDSK